jgi:hypothetical protein
MKIRSKLPKPAAVFLLIYAISLAGALYNHLNDIYRGGFLPYHWAPFWTNCYWTSLTFVEPVAIILLLLKPRYGVLLCIAIIVSDVIINFAFTGFSEGFDQLANPFFIMQFSFFCFVLGTCRYVLGCLNKTI